MKLSPGEAAVLIIYRNETDPLKYFLAVRKGSSSFNQGSHDFQLHGPQQAVLELGHELDFHAALEKAIIDCRKKQENTTMSEGSALEAYSCFKRSIDG